jgi:hypothetical protein
MKTKEKKAQGLQMVKIDQNKFAVQLIDGNVSVNLSQMAKAFGKRTSDWVKLKETQDYLQELSKTRNLVLADLVQVRHGGVPGTTGTWCTDHRIAMRFAQWLSTKFSIEVDELLVKLANKQAVIAEPIAGVWPIIHNGVVGYPRKELLEAAGYSYKSGTVRTMRLRWPEHHIIICRTACLTPKFARLRYEQGRVRQLEIDFRSNPFLS